METGDYRSTLVGEAGRTQSEKELPTLSSPAAATIPGVWAHTPTRKPRKLFFRASRRCPRLCFDRRARLVRFLCNKIPTTASVPSFCTANSARAACAHRGRRVGAPGRARVSDDGLRRRRRCRRCRGQHQRACAPAQRGCPAIGIQVGVVVGWHGDERRRPEGRDPAGGEPAPPRAPDAGARGGE